MCNRRTFKECWNDNVQKNQRFGFYIFEADGRKLRKNKITSTTSKLSHVINILAEIDPVTIVLVHSLMTVIAVIPVMRKNPKIRYDHKEFS